MQVKILLAPYFSMFVAHAGTSCKVGFMKTQQKILRLESRGQGPTEFTAECRQFLRQSGLQEGLLHVFCRHTSCSLVLMENADPSAWRDLHRWLQRLVPAKDADFTHTFEGPDDMPSHIKMALTRSGETIPFGRGELLLGTWQGVFLWEHRDAPHTRQIVLTLQGE
jgi:secondary thiamine-phosphate synthase enzyme